MAKKTATKGKGKVEKVMHEFKEGSLKSGSGRTVSSRKQAIAVALSEARKVGSPDTAKPVAQIVKNGGGNGAL